MLVGVWTELRIEVLGERYADNLQYSFLPWMRAEVVVAHPEGFAPIVCVSP